MNFLVELQHSNRVQLMNDLIRKISVLIVIILTSYTANFAQITIGAKTGLSLPGDDFSKSYSKVSDSVGNSQDLPSTVSNLGASGFHLIGSAYIDLGDNLDLVLSLGYNSFTETQMQLRDLSNNLIAKLSVTKNIIPIEVGMKYKVVKLGFISLYGVANTGYYLSNTSTDVEYTAGNGTTNYNILTSETTSRIGYGFGAGVQFDFDSLKPFFEFKANGANLIGKENGEASKNYYTASIGIIL